ncbi:tropomyosin isoform X21 [Ostrea edulis]|uniref:tropomyosin isoform X21 n=1 Tax=Ostrea edulis TaxID=37623 RepID=UPI0024AFD606|nr:tropomyosin isoform X21 [Ostrea edulis]
MERTGDSNVTDPANWTEICDSLQVDTDLGTGLSQDSMVSMSSSQLSQESVASTHSTDITSDILTPEISAKKKKKSGTKKVKKKKDKGLSDGETAEKVKKGKKDKTKKKKPRSSSSVRPEPEGGNPVNILPMDEYDRVIYSDDPLFSDMEISEEEEPNQKPRRPSRPGGLMFSCLSLGIQSNTMIKYAIIGTEVQNILKVSLRRAEQEIQGFNRRIQLLEEDMERSEERLQSATEKLEEASKAADESERGRRTLESRQRTDETRMDDMESKMRQLTDVADQSENRYTEAARKLCVLEGELERAEERYELAESKVKTLEDELHVATNSLKALEISDEKASQREDSYEETIRDLTQRLKDSQNRAEVAERQVYTLQLENDRLSDDLENERKHKLELQAEMEATLQDLSNL